MKPNNTDPTLDTLIKETTSPTHPRPLLNATREIRSLRRLIRQTHRRMDEGTLDFAAGASILTRSYNTLARILKTDHHIAPPPSPDAWADLHALIDRIITTPDPEKPPDHP